MLAEKRSRITRNLPIKVICPNTRHRIINQIIYEEFIAALWDRRRNWTRPARRRLLEYGIDLSEGVLVTYRRQIRNGERDPISAPSFSGDLFNGSYASRYGKDGMYKQFEMWQRFYVKTKGKYVGLPANQILSITRDFGAENTFACERDEVMAAFMFDLQRYFSKPPHATVIKKDIFEYLESSNNTFSIFDFDLMCQANTEGLLERLAACVSRTARFPAIINIATTVGRWITDEEYRSLMPYELIRQLRAHGIDTIDSYSGGYNDRIIPMRYEFLALSDLEKK